MTDYQAEAFIFLRMLLLGLGFLVFSIFIVPEVLKLQWGGQF